MNAIEIYDNADRKLNKSEITLGEYERLIDPLRNVIPILEGATNGDMIKAMFSDTEEIEERWDEVVVKALGSHRAINLSWWNAPYKGGK